MFLKPLKLLILLLLIGTGTAVIAGERNPRVAVATNFAPTMAEIIAAYQLETGRTVILIPGSTGKHYAQIINGAPFDLFFAADSERPALLEAAGLIVPGSRYSYALGQLVLWSQADLLIQLNATVLRAQNFHHLAIANPRLAPYGRAAREALENLGLWTALQDKLVRGENIAQTYQFVSSGNAELGLVALAQINADSGGSHWLVPTDLYSPIVQQAVALTATRNVQQFMAFMHSNQVRQIIRSYGYTIPASDIAATAKSGQTD